ncbi:hypothetical protein HYY69_02365 [Candidatus Woesearchaeota archaeon]|nr:hypothetical protein [Candidatus Woesearchaeota archaeon]
MAKKNTPKNNSHFSVYIYLVAIVAIVAIFYIVLMQKESPAIKDAETSTNVITGNVISPLSGNRDTYAVKRYFINNNEDWSTRIEVAIASAKEPVTDVIHKTYGVSTKVTSEESAKEVGTLSCTVSKEGSYGRVGKKNEKNWNQVRYDCKASFPEISTSDANKRHTITVIDSYGNVGKEEDVDDDRPEFTEFKYGSSSKKKVYFGTVLDRWELDKS